MAKPKKEDDPEKRAKRKEIMRRLKAEAMMEVQPLALGTFAMLASSLSNQALPKLMGRFIDQKSSSGSSSSSSDNHTLPPWSSLGLVVLGGGLASFIRTTMLSRAEDSITARLRNQAFESLLTHKDIEWFQTETVRTNLSADNEDDSDLANVHDVNAESKKTIMDSKAGVSPGAIGTILNEDVSNLSKSLTTNIASIVRSTSAVLFSTYHMLSLDPALFTVSLTIVPVIGAAAMLLRKSIKRVAAQQSDLAAAAASFVEERLMHIAMVKMSNREVEEVEQYSDMQEEGLRLGRSASIQNGMLMGFIFVASSGALLLVVNVGGKSVAAGKMSSGQLTSFATYSFLLGLGTSGIVKAVGEFMQGIVAAERFYRLVDPKEDDDEATDKKSNGAEITKVNIRAVESIALKDVCFSYKSTGVQVLNKVSLELKRGSVVALVGKNGCGKSTIASLLAGLYQPSAGKIELSDGTDITRVSKTCKKNLVQIVPQQTALFNMSILDNIRYSNPDASEEDVRRALKRANCESLLSKLEGGIHFVVGLNGSKLSGGERQRLALARALLSDPILLCMDEPASSLDSEGETAVSDALRACRESDQDGQGRALLLITHQAKSLELVDQIVVLEDGVIVETGLYKELSTRPNSELCRLMPELQKQI
jgi:ABC-type multidrug transport system fused ATPase/permease subunit